MSLSAPTLTSERLIMRCAGVEDAQQMLDYFERTKEAHRPYNPPAPPDFYTAEFWLRRCVINQEELERGSSARLSLWLKASAREEIIGQCNLTNIVRGAFQSCYLGYSLDPRYEGQGYMREAVGQVIALAFGPLNLHRIMANYMPDNARSARVLAAHGFVIEGQAKDYLMINGQWRDHVLTSLTNPSWSPAP